MNEQTRRPQVRSEFFDGERAFAEAMKVACPEPVGRWNPRPHGEVLQKLLEVTEGMGMAPNIDRLKVTFSHEKRARMFGTFPIDAVAREDHGYTVGFANSIDKSISLRIFFGTHVFVCSNGMMVGEFSEHRMHTINLDVSSTIRTVMERCEDVVNAEDERLAAIRGVSLINPEKMFFDAVQAGALAKSHIVDAYTDYNAALDRDRAAQIEVPGSLWAFQNAVTAQWKKTRNDESSVRRSFELKRLVEGALRGAPAA
jgi:hypothetical protein